jgi:TetR/AcrR family transcriptional regulator, cholesterol catabolism regulator
VAASATGTVWNDPLEEVSSVLPSPRNNANKRGNGTGRSSRSKRAEILATATEYFGRQGYEHTKWADVAAAVGIGSTALYHYFESKLHCLYEIQADAVQADRDKFDRIVAEHDDFAEALTAVLNGAFDLTELEVLRNRVLVAEQSLVGLQRRSPREEEARRLARSRIRDLEFAWATFLTRGMEQGVIPEVDPRLLARAVLGLYNSVWHWYRPRGSMSLDQVRDFYVPRCLAVAGLSSLASEPRKPAARKRPRRAAA